MFLTTVAAASASTAHVPAPCQILTEEAEGVPKGAPAELTWPSSSVELAFGVLTFERCGVPCLFASNFISQNDSPLTTASKILNGLDHAVEATTGHWQPTA